MDSKRFVYLVTSGTTDDLQIHAIFSTKELAEQFSKGIDDYYVYVDEYEVDEDARKTSEELEDVRGVAKTGKE